MNEAFLQLNIIFIPLFSLLLRLIFKNKDKKDKFLKVPCLPKKTNKKEGLFV